MTLKRTNFIDILSAAMAGTIMRNNEMERTTSDELDNPCRCLYKVMLLILKSVHFLISVIKHADKKLFKKKGHILPQRSRTQVIIAELRHLVTHITVMRWGMINASVQLGKDPIQENGAAHFY